MRNSYLEVLFDARCLYVLGKFDGYIEVADVAEYFVDLSDLLFVFFVNWRVEERNLLYVDLCD